MLCCRFYQLELRRMREGLFLSVRQCVIQVTGIFFHKSDLIPAENVVSHEGGVVRGKDQLGMFGVVFLPVKQVPSFTDQCLHQITFARCVGAIHHRCFQHRQFLGR